MSEQFRKSHETGLKNPEKIEQSTISKDIGKLAMKNMVERPESIYIENGKIEKEPSEYEKARFAVEDYIIATEFLSELTGQNLDKYIDKNEIDMFKMNKDSDEDENEKPSTYDLQAVFHQARKRKQNSTFADDPLNRRDSSELKRSLKTNYILGLGEKLTSYIESGSVKNFGEARRNIRTLFDSAYVSQRKFLELINLYGNTEFRQSKIRDIERLFNGMRHELAFKEMIYEGNVKEKGELFTFEDDDKDIDLKTQRKKELEGVDMSLNTKLILDKNGNYRFPVTEEEYSSYTHEAIVDIDVKASKTAADKAMEKRARYHYDKKEGESLIMWSHVYNDDFRLDMDDGLPILGYDRNEEPVYLGLGQNGSEQMSIMHKLDKNFNLKYKDENGMRFHPETFEERYRDIKRQLLFYINKNKSIVKNSKK